MKNKAVYILVLTILALSGTLGSNSVYADDLAADAESLEAIEPQEKSASEATESSDEDIDEELYSNPANDPNMLSSENEGRIQNRDFQGQAGTVHHEILDYSKTSERYPSATEE